MKHANPRTIVITGVTRGLGRALAEAFAKAGARLAGCGSQPRHVAAAAQAFPAPHLMEVCDVADAEAVAAFAAKVLDRLGPPDLVINNAALINRPAPIWAVPPDEFSRLVDVNIKGVYHVMRAFLPAMVKAGRGVVANLSSGWGRSTSPEVAPYCATKWAVEGLSQAAAHEVPPGVAVCAVNPGVIDTDMLRTCWAEGASAYPAPAAWAKTAAPFFLNLGPDANGQALTVG